MAERKIQSQTTENTEDDDKRLYFELKLNERIIDLEGIKGIDGFDRPIIFYLRNRFDPTYLFLNFGIFDGKNGLIRYLNLYSNSNIRTLKDHWLAWKVKRPIHSLLHTSISDDPNKRILTFFIGKSKFS